MKYCLSSRQTMEYLSKCDEIKVMWNDKNIIFDLIEKYPGKRIDLRKYYNHEGAIDWKEIENFKALAQGNFLFGVSHLQDIHEANKRSIPWYYLEPLRTFGELRAIKELGAAAAIIDAPIFFQMDKVKQFNLPIRVSANVSMTSVVPTVDGVTGPWIRPEDVNQYEPYVDCIEFTRVNFDQERALYRIYAEQHRWPGEIGLIIQDINHQGLNRLIGPEVTRARLNCAQRCQEASSCQICYRALRIADANKLKEIAQAQPQTN